MRLAPIFLLLFMPLESKGPQRKGYSPWHLPAASAHPATPLHAPRVQCSRDVGTGTSPIVSGPNGLCCWEYIPGQILSCQVRTPGPHARGECQAPPVPRPARAPLTPDLSSGSHFLQPGVSGCFRVLSERCRVRRGDSRVGYDNGTLTHDLQEPNRNFHTVSPT